MRFIRRIGKYLYYYLSNPKNIIMREQVVSTVDGIKHICDGDNYIERSILESGVWEEKETFAVKEVVKAGFVVFDVGANIGYYTLLMSKLVGPSGQVHCFEPTAYAFDRLQKNININTGLSTSSIKLNKNALASHTDKRVDSLESRFSLKYLANDDEEIIEFITMDDYCENEGIERLDFIKIDVDGYDLDIIEGGRSVFNKYKPIVMAEICDRVLKKQNANYKQYLRKYLEYGYTQAKLLETSELSLLSDLIEDKRLQEGTWNILLN